MTNITHFDAKTCRQFGQEVEAAVKATAERHGRIPETREAEAFRGYAHHVNLQADDLGKTFTYKGKSYTIRGLRLGRKNPILAEREDGKEFTVPLAIVTQALGRAA